MTGRRESPARQTPRPRVSPHVVLAVIVAVMIVAVSILATVWDRWAGDINGVRLFQGMLNDVTEPIAGGITVLGDARVSVALGLLSTGWLLYIRRPRLAGTLVLVLVLTGMLVQVLKWSVNRPRPELPTDLDILATSSSASFPSGHVAFVALFFSALAYFIYRDWRAPPWRRGVLIVLLLIPVIVIGPARLAWGVHWPSDVLGGYMIALLGVQALTLLSSGFGSDRPEVGL